MPAKRLPDTQPHAAKAPTIGVFTTGAPRVDEETRFDGLIRRRLTYAAEAGDRVPPGSRIARLRLTLQKVAGHAELPVGGVQESHGGESMAGRRQVRGPRPACVRQVLA